MFSEKQNSTIGAPLLGEQEDVLQKEKDSGGKSEIHRIVRGENP